MFGFFLLNHFSFAQDNHVTRRSMKSIVNTADCTSTMRLNEDQNKYSNWKKRGEGMTFGLSNQRYVGQVGD